MGYMPTHCPNCGTELKTIYDRRNGLCPRCWDRETEEIDREEQERRERGEQA
jgi:uncharacterized Zn finger protein (UPF0148 family)